MRHTPPEPGAKFGKWTVIRRTEGTRHDKIYYECRCDCGTVKPVVYHLLTTEMSNGCRRCMWGNRSRDTQYDDMRPALKRLFRNYKHTAHARGLSFDLTAKQFIDITSSDCHYCGLPPKQEATEKRLKMDDDVYTFNGIDRTDNNIGYVLANCVACCKMCNLAKRDVPYSDWLSYIQRLTAHTHQNHLSNSSPASMLACTNS